MGLAKSTSFINRHADLYSNEVFDGDWLLKDSDWEIVVKLIF